MAGLFKSHRMSRLRHARREFGRTYPEAGEKIATEQLAMQRRVVRNAILSRWARNVLIGGAAALVIYLRCAP